MARYYKHKGRDLPSVTTVCGILEKQALLPWAVNATANYIMQEIEPYLVDSDLVDDMKPYYDINADSLNSIIEASKKNYRKVSARAMNIGSAVHAAIERYLNLGQEPEAPSDDVLSAFLGFLDWMSEHKVETIHAEQTVYSEMYAGTTDLVAMLDGVKYVVDFKTYNETSSTQPPYPEAKYQVAAYRNCIEGTEGCGLLYLGKSTGKMVWVDTSNTYEKDLRIFNHLVEIFYETHEELRRE
jgi:hypothetical protein